MFNLPSKGTYRALAAFAIVGAIASIIVGGFALVAIVYIIVRGLSAIFGW